MKYTCKKDTIMALINYTLPFGNMGPAGMNWGTISTGLQTPRADTINGLLYDPADHQAEQSRQFPNLGGNSGGGYYRNDPYAPPYQRSQYDGQSNHYLPPQPTTRSPYRSAGADGDGGYSRHQVAPPTRSYGESSYSRQVQENNAQTSYFEQVNYRTDSAPASFSQARPAPTKPSAGRGSGPPRSKVDTGSTVTGSGIPERPGGYVKVQGGQGKKTQAVAVIDYDEDESDDDEYYDADGGSNGGAG